MRIDTRSHVASTWIRMALRPCLLLDVAAALGVNIPATNVVDMSSELTYDVIRGGIHRLTAWLSHPRCGTSAMPNSAMTSLSSPVILSASTTDQAVSLTRRTERPTRMPTVEKIKSTFWNPDGAIVVDRVFGVGWTINLGAVVAKVRSPAITY